MPNLSAPNSPRYTGWFNDQVNGKLELYYRGTLVQQFDATTITTPSTHTQTVAGAVNFDGAVDFDSTINTAGAGTWTPNVKLETVVLGTTAAIASNGAGAILPDIRWVAPVDLVIKSAFKTNISASDVTVGTSVSSASYRRFTLITNTAATGSGTNIVASLNATAAVASNLSRAFTTVASTVPAGAVVLVSHLTVGAETADGTDAAAATFQISYEAV